MTMPELRSPTTNPRCSNWITRGNTSLAEADWLSMRTTNVLRQSISPTKRNIGSLHHGLFSSPDPNLRTKYAKRRSASYNRPPSRMAFLKLLKGNARSVLLTIPKGLGFE